MKTRQSEIELNRLVDEGGNASIPDFNEIEVTIDPEYKLVTLSAASIAAIKKALDVCIYQTVNDTKLVEAFANALVELKRV